MIWSLWRDDENHHDYLIKHVRKYLNAPKLPVVIAEQTGPWVDAPVAWATLRKARKEPHLDRRLADRRIGPAIDTHRSGTRRDELLLIADELRAVTLLRRVTADLNAAEAMEFLTNRLRRTKSNTALFRDSL